MRILLVNCSIRSGGFNGNSNSDIALRAAYEGVKEKVVMADSLVLRKYMLEDGKILNEKELVGQVKTASGIIFSTPVYFGNFSSMLYDLFKLLKLHKVSLEGKVVGFCAVGAKRNGGQETTIVSGAWEAMNLGAIVVNDGAPVSQFGGVVVAGDLGDAINDIDGLKVCKNLGRRVAETAMILDSGNTKEKVKIRIWDSNYLAKKYRFFRCNGCRVCPQPNNDKDFKCINHRDDMEKIHKWLMETDGVIPFGLNMHFYERTRYLRRDNYRLTYHVVKITDIRQIPLFIKENAILCRKNLGKYTKLVKSGKRKLSLTKQVYEPIGYKTV